ncbi:MAG: glycosyltransferase family 87 protein [Mucilaginibacter sp.]|uniref:glycosyltransferase family 87 protein n=1 Tax=Mucilaginibacter sp. TaxID=1882438 RepID=UPI0034E4C82D
MSSALNFLTKKSTALFLWFGLSFFVAIKQAFGHLHNNYLIYKFTFFNLVHQHNLYLPQPEHFLDVNHYGPVFALFIAPFVWLPDSLAVALWIMFNAWVLYQAITHLPIANHYKTIVLLLCAHELMTASFSDQFNPCMAAIILGSFILIREKKDFWAACLIILGTFIKLYGIVGLAFFFFSDQKIKLILSLLFWSVVFFVLPMAISSPAFVIQTYQDWKNVLIEKDAQNAASVMQDISVIGMVRRIFMLPKISDLVVLLPALALFGSSYLFIKKYQNLSYQLLILSSTLLFTVLFSSGSESPTYIIAFVGVAIWFVNLPKPVTKLQIALLVFAFILTSLSPSDIFPKFIQTQYIVKYSLKALPCFLVWLYVIYETWTRSAVAETQKVELAV